jgi:hypothetical protein
VASRTAPNRGGSFVGIEHEPHACNGFPLSVVYLVASADLHKIGMSSFYPMRKRLKELRLCSAVPVKWVGSAIVCCPRMALAVERQLHQQFAYARHHGEWFSLRPHEVAAIMKRLRSTALDRRRFRRRKLYLEMITARANRNAGRLDQPPSADASDPYAADPGNPPTRV